MCMCMSPRARWKMVHRSYLYMLSVSVMQAGVNLYNKLCSMQYCKPEYSVAECSSVLRMVVILLHCTVLRLMHCCGGLEVESVMHLLRSSHTSSPPAQEEAGLEMGIFQPHSSL